MGPALSREHPCVGPDLDVFPFAGPDVDILPFSGPALGYTRSCVGVMHNYQWSDAFICIAQMVVSPQLISTGV